MPCPPTPRNPPFGSYPTHNPKLALHMLPHPLFTSPSWPSYHIYKDHRVQPHLLLHHDPVPVANMLMLGLDEPEAHIGDPKACGPP